MNCYKQPWQYGAKPWPYPDGIPVGNPEDEGDWGDDDGLSADEYVTCSPSSTTTTTTTTSEKPTETPHRPEKPSVVAGNPSLNRRDCYHNTKGIDRVTAADLIGRFCGDMDRQLLRPDQEYARSWPYSPPGSLGYNVRLWFGVTKDSECSWVGGKTKEAQSLDGASNGTSMARRDVTDSNLCTRYMNAIVDSCNCAGIDGKEGGKISNDCFFMGIHPMYKH